MPLWTLVELEKDSKVSRYTWRSWIRAGKLPAIHAGRTIRVDETDYRKFIEANKKVAVK